MTRDLSLVLATNMWSHLHTPLARELLEALGEDRFRLVLTEPVTNERRRLGWPECYQSPNWVIGPPKDDAQLDRLVQACLAADVAVMGYGPIEERVRAGKLTLIMGERLLKRGWHGLRMISPRYANAIRRFRQRANSPNVHALAIGYCAPHDLRAVDAYGDRIWTWGYFVDVSPEPPSNIPDRPLRLLWAGRMLRWKQVDLLLRVLQRVQGASWFGGCSIVGDGPERSHLIALATKLGLDQSRIHFHAPVPYGQVRALMRESDVYVLASNRQEGWGAVSGEAMSEGCVLLANQEAGSARVLVEDGVTGFLFRDGDPAHLAEQLEWVASDSHLRTRVRQEAWQRMQSLWHPRIAARRLVALCESLLDSTPPPDYPEGPCRRATGGA